MIQTLVHRRAAAGAAIPALLALLAAAPSPATAESYTLRGDRFAIHNLAGRVEVVASDGTEAEIEVVRGGRDARQLTVETGTIDGRPTLRVIYPGTRIHYPHARGTVNHVTVGRDGTLGGRAGAGSRRVTVSSRGGGLEAWADLRIRVPRGRPTEARLACGEISASGVYADLVLDTHAGHVRAERIDGTLRIDTGSGPVEVREVTGDLTIDTGSGSVIAGAVRGSGVSIDTGSGPVECSGIEADRLDVDTGSGSVSLASVAAPVIRVDTGSGEVYLELERDVESVLIDTGSGGVTLQVPAGLGAEVSIDTGSGGITSEVAMEATSRGRGELRGRIGDGRGRIVIGTGSGRVRLLD